MKVRNIVLVMAALVVAMSCDNVEAKHGGSSKNQGKGGSSKGQGNGGSSKNQGNGKDNGKDNGKGGDGCHPSPKPTKPTPHPTRPTPHPTKPTKQPTSRPTPLPTKVPTTAQPTALPTKVPTTAQPTALPTKVPTTAQPTALPTKMPTTPKPTALPTKVPTTAQPTSAPSTPPPTIPRTTCEYVCESYSYTWTDPHLTTLYGDEYKLPNAPAVDQLYNLDGWNVTGHQSHYKTDNSGFQAFDWIYVGEEDGSGDNVTAADLCDPDTGGQTSFFHAFGDTFTSNYAEVNILCQQYLKKKSLGWFLQVELIKVNAAEEGQDFAQTEDALGSYGAMVQEGQYITRRALRRRKLISPDQFQPQFAPRENQGQCYETCTGNDSSCSGDPECVAFSGEKFKLQPSEPTNYTVYNVDGTTSFDKENYIGQFNVEMVTKNSGRTYGYDFNGTYVSADQCEESGQKFQLSNTWPSGDRVYVELTCRYANKNPSEYGLFFDSVLYKFDRDADSSNGVDWFTIEQEEGATGIAFGPPDTN